MKKFPAVVFYLLCFAAGWALVGGLIHEDGRQQDRKARQENKCSPADYRAAVEPCEASAKRTNELLNRLEKWLDRMTPPPYPSYSPPPFPDDDQREFPARLVPVPMPEREPVE
jgi:hypothetical protein